MLGEASILLVLIDSLMFDCCEEMKFRFSELKLEKIIKFCSSNRQIHSATVVGRLQKQINSTSHTPKISSYQLIECQCTTNVSK